MESLISVYCLYFCSCCYCIFFSFFVVVAVNVAVVLCIYMDISVLPGIITASFYYRCKVLFFVFMLLYIHFISFLHVCTVAQVDQPQG